MQTQARKVDWEQVKRCIAQINKTSKEFLYRALLIGGSAVWFYRNRLKLANDPDFKVVVNPSDEIHWLSKDIDFTGISLEDAFLLLPANRVTTPEGRQYVEIEGVRFGFAQAGVSLDPEEAFEFAWPATTTFDGEEIEFLVADPLTLYFEKRHLQQKRGYPNDHLHAELLYEYISYDLVAGAERILCKKASVSEAQSILVFWKRVNMKASEFFKDKRVLARLGHLPINKPGFILSHYLANI